MLKLTGLESNIWKHFVILFTSRRNFVPILSIYYLSLNNTTAQEISFWMMGGYIFSLIFQIPAGYLGDRLGNKITIIISKILLLISSFLFIIGDSFVFFLFGAIFQALGSDSFTTGNTGAFLHDTLTQLGKEKDFKKISSKMKGWASFLSVFFIVTLPFFTKISLNFPFIIGFGVDIIGLIIALTLYPVKSTHNESEKISLKNLKVVLNSAKGTGLFSVIIFSGLAFSFLQVDSSFRGPYLESLGYPIMFIGAVMGLSRFIRFLVGMYAHKIENYISFEKLMFFEIILFSFYYVGVYFITNPYILGLLFSIVIGYYWGRSDIYTDHIINLIPGKKYKSTILSIKGFITSISQIILMFGIGFVMNKSYSLGFLVLGIILFITLGIVYLFGVRYKR